MGPWPTRRPYANGGAYVQSVQEPARGELHRKRDTRGGFRLLPHRAHGHVALGIHLGRRRVVVLEPAGGFLQHLGRMRSVLDRHRTGVGGRAHRIRDVQRAGTLVLVQVNQTDVPVHVPERGDGVSDVRFRVVRDDARDPRDRVRYGEQLDLRRLLPARGRTTEGPFGHRRPPCNRRRDRPVHVPEDRSVRGLDAAHQQRRCPIGLARFILPISIAHTSFFFFFFFPGLPFYIIIKIIFYAPQNEDSFFFLFFFRSAGSCSFTKAPPPLRTSEKALRLGSKMI